jgi:hypothetical protein
MFFFHSKFSFGLHARTEKTGVLFSKGYPVTAPRFACEAGAGPLLPEAPRKRAPARWQGRVAAVQRRCQYSLLELLLRSLLPRPMRRGLLLLLLLLLLLP